MRKCEMLTVGEPGGEKKERAANLINIGNGAVQVYLSSAAKEDPKSDDTVLIGPPFYLDLKIAGFSLPIQVCLHDKSGDKLSGKAVNASLFASMLAFSFAVMHLIYFCC